MTHKQIKWAKQHDWFLRCAVRDNKKAVVVADTLVSTEIVFTDYQLLRHWAGY